jgi:3-oxoadipate enol-lactonase
MLPYDEAGAGPVVVLLHAGIADRTMWSGLLEPLSAAGFRAIAPDLPGFGEAPVPERFAPHLDVLATLDDLAVWKAVFVGVSFGGAIAQRVVLAARERVAGLMLVSSPAEGIAPSAELAAAWQAEEAALEADDIEGAVTAVLDAWLLPDASAELRARVGTMQQRAFENAMAAPEPADVPDPLEENPDLLRTVAGIHTLVAVGERDLPDFHAAAKVLAEQLGVEPVVIPGARHMAPLETPDTFLERLLGFLA